MIPARWRWRLAQHLEKRWWQHYLRHKNVKEYLRWKQNYWKQFLMQVDVMPPKGSHILDAGCGPAGIFMALPDCHITAIDPLLKEYEAKIAHFQPHHYPWVSFECTTIEQFSTQLPQDFIFCINAINHVADLDTCLFSLYSSLRAGGTIIISSDAHKSHLVRRIFQWLPGDVLHPQQHTAYNYGKKMEEAGFRIVKEITLSRSPIFDYKVWVATK